MRPRSHFLRPPAVRLVPLVLLAAAAAGGARSGTAQELQGGRVVTVLDTRDGLPQNSVNDLLESRDGFLWVATFGGLARYDGQAFHVYDLGTDPALPGVRVMAVDEDSRGRLWVGLQQHGVVVLEGGAFRPVLPVEETRLVRDVTVDDGDRVWLATARGAGYLDQDERFVRVGPADLRQASATSVVPDPDGGAVWVVYGRRVALVLGADDDVSSPEVRSRIDLPPDLGDVYRHARLLAPGRLEVPAELGVVEVTADGVAGRAPAGRRTLPVAGGRWDLDLPFLTWRAAGSDGGEDWSYEWGGQTAISWLETRDGSLWLGDRVNGLIHVRPTPIRRTPALGEVSDLAVDREDRVWFLRCELYRIDEAETELVPRPVPTPGPDCLTGLEVDTAGVVWARRDRFALRRQEGRWLRPLELPGTGRAQGPFESTDHRIWFLADERLVWWDDSVWREGGELPLRPGEEITSVLATDDGFYLGTDLRLIRWSRAAGEPVQVWELGRELAQGTVRGILSDGSGGVWVGHYGGGITRIDDRGGMRRLSSVEGLPDNFVVGLARDLQGTIWISGNKGVYAVTPAEMERYATGETSRLRVIRIGPGEGVPEGSGRGVAMTSDGVLWFPTIEGVAALDPDDLLDSDASARVVIDRVRIQGRPVSRVALQARSRVNDLSVEYTAPRMVRPENIRFQYRMQGLGDGWTDVGNRREVYFTRLTPGRYTFEVQATALESGRVSRATLPVEVVPAWYQTLFFRALAVLAFLGLAFVILRRRVAAAESEARRAQAQTAELKREIAERERLEQERNALSAQLLQAQKLEAVGRLTGGIAHDFNNLLTAMLGHLDLLAPTVEPGSRDHIAALHASAERAGSLTRGLLAFSRRSQLQPRDIRADELLESVRTLIQAGLPPNVGLELVCDSDVPVIRADWGSLENAVVNLCINARDAMPAGGTILVTAEGVDLGRRQAARWEVEPGRYARIAVTDDGTGMAPELLEHVLEPFFTTKEVGEGTGLGLSMAFGFAKQSGGHLVIDSVEGEGTTVSIYLPGAEDPAAHVVGRHPPETRGRGRRILVVEDDPAVREIAEEYLKILDFRPVGVESVADARTVLAEDPGIDLIVSDVMLPGESGFDLAREVEADPRHRTLILMSGGAPLQEQGVRRREGLSGEVLFLLKPFTRDQLARVLERALAGRVGSDPSPQARKK